jgi:DNA-directed RNA polymerase specialized sigma24 family protein
VDDNDIRAALRRGHDEAAFRLLLQAHGPAVYTACCQILRNATAAEDAMQQAMMAMFTHQEIPDRVRLRVRISANQLTLSAQRTLRTAGQARRTARGQAATWPSAQLATPTLRMRSIGVRSSAKLE